LLDLAGLVPAAGASRRMGRDKRRLPFQGQTVLEVTLDSLRQGGLNPLAVVLEPDSPCEGLAGLRDVIRLTNPSPQHGMLSSIRVGLRELARRGVDGVAVLPGDHPFVPPAAVRRLHAVFSARRPLLLAPRFGPRRGHPLVIARALFDEALACDDEVGLRQLVRRRAADLLELPLEHPGAEHDIDRPADLQRLDRRQDD
jgi:CTP:molybdopterin cytidylyltransferase MocA